MYDDLSGLRIVKTQPSKSIQYEVIDLIEWIEKRFNIDKGLEGELYARLILTLARNKIPPELSSDNLGLMFSVKDFLEHLCTK